MTPLNTYYVSSNIGSSFRCGLNVVVLEHGTALYLASEVDAALAEAQHCKDCCCARSWEALGIQSHTGRSIVEHIEMLRQQLATVTQERDDWHRDASSHLQALCEQQAEVNRLECQVAQVTQQRDVFKAKVHTP